MEAQLAMATTATVSMKEVNLLGRLAVLRQELAIGLVIATKTRVAIETTTTTVSGQRSQRLGSVA